MPSARARLIAATSVADWPQVVGPFALMWVPTTRMPVSRPMRMVSPMPSVAVSLQPRGQVGGGVYSPTMLGVSHSGSGDWLRWWE